MNGSIFCMSPSEKRLKTFINDIQCEILVVDESTLTENIDFSEYSSLESCILLSENQLGCQGSGLLERRRPSIRPPVHADNRPKFGHRPSIPWTDWDTGPRLSVWGGRVEALEKKTKSVQKFRFQGVFTHSECDIPHPWPELDQSTFFTKMFRI